MNSYLEQSILNADPVELIRILYRHGLLSVREAREHLRAGRAEERARCLRRALGVVAELTRALRPEAAPEIVVRLMNVYVYMLRRLMEANEEPASFEAKDKALTEVLGLMTTLSEAWAPQAQAQSAAPAGLAWQAAMANGGRSRIEIRG